MALKWDWFLKSFRVKDNGAGGTPAGSNGQVQFNDNDSFGADSNLFWDNTAKELQTGVIRGSNQTSGNLTLKSTSNATKGKIFLGTNSVYDEANDRLGIGLTNPTNQFYILADGSGTPFRLKKSALSDQADIAFSSAGSPSPTNVQWNFGMLANVNYLSYRYFNGTSTQDVLRLDNDGKVRMPVVYNTTVGVTNRDLYIQDNGILGYVSSALKYKENLRDISQTDIDNIFKIPVKKFDYKDTSKGIDQLGIIAEDMEQYFPNLCSYKYEYIFENEGEGEDIITNKIPVLDEQGNHIKELETIQYSKVGLLALLAVKNLNDRLKILEGI